MTQPGAQQQYPHGQPYPQQFPPEQQYPPQYQQGVPWAQPPKKRRGKGVLTGVLVVVLLAGLAGGGLWLWEELDDPAPPPPVDASEDLKDAPVGCAVFDEQELAPYVAGRIEVEAQGDHESAALDRASCRWRGDSTQPMVTVTSMVNHTSGQRSGVDLAKEFLDSQSAMPRMVALDVAHADEAGFFPVNEYAAYVVVRKGNVVYRIAQNGAEPISGLQQSLEELATIAIGKVGN